MGFPSPANDYAEKTLTIEGICGISLTTKAFATTTGFVVVDTEPPRICNGDTVLVDLGGRMQFGQWAGGALITEDGEAVEGDALDGVIVKGRVMFTILSLIDDDCPVI